MENVQITGYHTCKTEGGWSYLKAEAPFLSRNGQNQWLTQGYYFWTDSAYFAHKWGKDSYGGNYAILKCKIEMDKELLLDLVGSTEAQLYFERLLTKYKAKLKKTDSRKKPTVNAVIAYWRKQAERNKEIFPFVAIKVQDGFRGSTLDFISSKKRAVMHIGIQRQQLCLFEYGLSFLTEKEIIHPQEFIRS